MKITAITFMQAVKLFPGDVPTTQVTLGVDGCRVASIELLSSGMFLLNMKSGASKVIGPSNCKYADVVLEEKGAKAKQ